MLHASPGSDYLESKVLAYLRKGDSAVYKKELYLHIEKQAIARQQLENAKANGFETVAEWDYFREREGHRFMIEVLGCGE